MELRRVCSYARSNRIANPREALEATCCAAKTQSIEVPKSANWSVRLNRGDGVD
jgi:hypothetical protein